MLVFCRNQWIQSTVMPANGARGADGGAAEEGAAGPEAEAAEAEVW
jgi:hypothetical protein